MNVIITGSTKGIGLAMARKFLEFGDKVVICSRTEERVESVVNQLTADYGDNKVFGIPCDVSKMEDMDKLADLGVCKLGNIDIWINNAGTNGYQVKPLIDFDPKLLRVIVETNLLGTLYGCKAALRIMTPKNRGHIFNMEGMGSNGQKTPNLIAYGASKRAIPLLTASLIKELKKAKVGIHILSPGIVLTDLILHDIEPRAAKVFNILAEKPQTVVDYLVPKIRKVKGTGKAFRFLTMKKAFIRFMTAWRYKNRFFDDSGNLIEKE